MHGPIADLAPRGLVLLAAASKRTADPRLWYVTRAAAISAYVALTATTGLGLLRSLARALGVGVSWALDELHQFVALLAAAFVALHLLSLLLDPYLPFPLVSLLLPVAEPYRPLASALGVLGLYALAAVLVSSWLRRRLTYRLWRGLHYASFASFALVTLHGLLAGADASQPWMRAVYTGAAVSIAFLVLMRLLLGRRVAQPEPVTMPLAQLPPPSQSQH
jgi:methionine sulfoxide reductase heme-binding subunit